MRKSFGNTYWGKQWLNALTYIDNTNRLPRGKTYARKGAVRDIEINNGTITASVSGSSYQPYNVKIQVQSFGKKERQVILDMVVDNPMHLSVLLNRQLPRSLNETFQDAGINIFPSSWKDINGRCSCPDAAVPCKHIAAVLYLIANEIDKNPFLIFDLHGFDLLEELEKIGFFTEGQPLSPISSIDELYESISLEHFAFKWSEEIFNALDFSTIPNCEAQLLTIYGDDPVFYPEGNFKSVIKKVYTKVAKQLGKKRTQHELEIPLTQIHHINVLLDQNLHLVDVTLLDVEEKVLKNFDSTTKWVSWLETVPMRDAMRYSNALAGIVIIYQLAKRLAQHWAYLPQLQQLTSKGFVVRWLPAYINTVVREHCEQVAQLVPSDIVFFKVGNIAKQSKQEQHFDNLIAIFLTHFVHAHHGLQQRFWLNDIINLFFRGMVEQLTGFEYQRYPDAIQQWLGNFRLREKEYLPIIQVEEVENSGDGSIIFGVTAAIDARRDSTNAPIPIDQLFIQDEYKYLRIHAIRDLAMLTEHFPPLSDYLAQKGRTPMLFDNKSFVDVLFKILPVIRLFGIKVLLPKSLRRVVRPTASLGLQTKANSNTNNSNSLVSLSNMMSFDWVVAMGEDAVTPEEFIELTQQFEGIVKLNDQFVYFDEKELKTLLQKMQNPPELSSNGLLQVALTEEYERAKVQLSKEAQELLGQLLDVEEIDVPTGLLATLRPYQHRGFSWLYKNAKLGFGSIIADDMGLGKTLQVITTLLKLKEEGAFEKNKALVIVPTTLLTNWYKEIAKFAPALKAHVYHGSGRKIAPLDDADILITTYGLVRSEQKTLTKYKWLLVAIDEAQAIKNPTTSQTRAIKKIKAPIKIAMSGTPVENRLTEYWSIFDFVNKGYLGSLTHFKKAFAKDIEVERDQQKLQQFKQITSPFILRRLKSDRSIIKDLPAKIEKDHFCSLTSEQTALYENVVKQTMQTIEQSEGIQRKGLVLKLITALKQICNHPYQFLKKGLVEPQRSGKTSLLFELVSDILDKGEKALIFTQYQTMGDYISHMLEIDMGIHAEFLHGGIRRKERDKMVDRFQQNRDTRILILSLKAGGTGLNLTAANHVIHYDLWWNPAVEAQATDRAYRIGQNRNVLVHRFITQGTFEEKINELLQIKKELANMTVATGETWIGDYDDTKLRALVDLH
ncbi:MAG: SNF2-related protein [Bacteroidota bacterium]